MFHLGPYTFLNAKQLKRFRLGCVNNNNIPRMFMTSFAVVLRTHVAVCVSPFFYSILLSIYKLGPF